MKKIRFLRLTAVILLGAVFAVSAYKILHTVVAYERSKENHEAVSREHVTVLEPPAPVGELPPAETAPIRVDFQQLLGENADVVGWIYCADTPINYPVVQSVDNAYYLRRGLDKNYDIGGTVFMDYRSDALLQNRNTLIYGHNMKNDTMFGTLVHYKEQSYYDAHPTLWYLTPQGDYKIQLIAGLVTEEDSTVYRDYPSQETLTAALKEAMALSTFRSEVDLGEVEQIITISTCSYEFEEARYVLLGTLKKI